jgi:hypothetical protein
VLQVGQHGMMMKTVCELYSACTTVASIKSLPLYSLIISLSHGSCAVGNLTLQVVGFSSSEQEISNSARQNRELYFIYVFWLIQRPGSSGSTTIFGPSTSIQRYRRRFSRSLFDPLYFYHRGTGYQLQCPHRCKREAAPYGMLDNIY